MVKLLALILAVAFSAGAQGSTAGGQSVQASAAGPQTPEFSFVAQPIPGEIRKKMRGVSWHRGCPVPLSSMRHLQIAHWDFSGRIRTGELVVHRDTVPALRTVFSRLFEKRFPIRRMRLVDHYGGDDYRSIEADNTSAFNCRRATGSASWSQHSYGRAIDINPIENPYVYSNGTTSHKRSKKYLNRSKWRKGMIVKRGVVVRAFKSVGWGWGGDWSSPKDYQHFSAGRG